MRHERSFAEATPGNHDYWFNGVPSLAANSWLLGYDQFANGHAQFFAQVTWLLNEVSEWNAKKQEMAPQDFRRNGLDLGCGMIWYGYMMSHNISCYIDVA